MADLLNLMWRISSSIKYIPHVVLVFIGYELIVTTMLKSEQRLLVQKTQEATDAAHLLTQENNTKLLAQKPPEVADESHVTLVNNSEKYHGNIHPYTREVVSTMLHLSANKYLREMEDRCKKTYKYLLNPPDRELCPCVSPLLEGPIKVRTGHIKNWSELHTLIKNVEAGGIWSPRECEARTQVAIIVPCRDRQSHLRTFLFHMHPILQRQQLHYQIFVVEQAWPAIFNKAAMMNAAFLEIMKDDWSEWDCIVFHDVDVYLEDDRNLIHCREQSHISLVTALDRWDYKNRYFKVFGGAVAVPPEMMWKANGFSNSYFGWGGEDDNFEHRLEHSGSIFWRPPLSVSKYSTFTHARDVTNNRKWEETKDMQNLAEQLEMFSHESHSEYNKEVSNLPTYPHHKQYNYSMMPGACIVEKQAHMLYTLSHVSCQHMCDTMATCAEYTYTFNLDVNQPCVLFWDKCKTMAEDPHPDTVLYSKESLLQ